MSEQDLFFMLVACIPQQLTREELYAIYSENANVLKLKVMRYLSPIMSKEIRLAFLQVEKWNDTARVAARFIGRQKKRASSFLVSNSDELCQRILSRQLQIKVTSSETSSTFPELLERELKQQGDISFVKKDITEQGLELLFTADSSYSYRDLTTNHSLILEDECCLIDTADDILTESEFFEILPNVQPRKNIIREQDFSIQELKRLIQPSTCSWIPSSTISVHSSDSLFKEGITSADDNLSCSESEDLAETDSMMKFDSDLIGDRSCYSFFSERVIKLKSLAENPKKIPSIQWEAVEQSPKVADPPQSPPAVNHSASISLNPTEQLFTNPEVQNIIRSRPKPPKREITKEQERKTLQKYQENTLEILNKLSKLGIDVNKEFLESLLLRVDPNTTPQELPKSFLKIVKTKFRKLKRREKKKFGKKGQHMSESEDFDSEEEDNIQNTNKPHKDENHRDEAKNGVSKGEGSEYPEIWLNFVRSLQPLQLDYEEDLSQDKKGNEAKSDCFLASIKPQGTEEESPIIANKLDAAIVLTHGLSGEPLPENYRLNFILETERSTLLANLERSLNALQAIEHST